MDYLIVYVWMWYVLCFFCLNLIVFVFNCFVTVRGKDKEVIAKKDSGARSYTFRELATATQNFKNVNLIGEGGFGSVYKGRLDTGQVNSSLSKINFMRLKVLKLKFVECLIKEYC